MNSGQIVTPIIKNRGNYIGNLRVRSNLVLDDLPVVERGRDIFILHSKVDFLLYITDIGILQDAVGAGVNCEVTSKPEKQFSSFIVKPKSKSPIPCPNRPQIPTPSLKNPKTQFFGLGLTQ